VRWTGRRSGVVDRTGGLRDSLQDLGKSWDIPGMGQEQRKQEPQDVLGCSGTARSGAEG